MISWYNPITDESVGNDFRYDNGDGWGIFATYDMSMGFSAGVDYASSDCINDQIIHSTTDDDKTDVWTAGLKYDASNIYLATMYAETHNMTPYGDGNGVANKTQNLEITAQYQFDFGLRPAISYLQSKGKDLNIAGGNSDKDLVKYADIGATYYFNKNMSTYIDHKINRLDDDDNLYRDNASALMTS